MIKQIKKWLKRKVGCDDIAEIFVNIPKEAEAEFYFNAYHKVLRELARYNAVNAIAIGGQIRLKAYEKYGEPNVGNNESK